MVRMKLGRNDPCWCGSGMKYKRCHLNREMQRPLEPWEASKAFREALSTKHCLAPQAWLDKCHGRIVRAHTVPKSGSLKTIVRDGHVYSLDLSLDGITKTPGGPVLKLCGINRASTFTGFCSSHDSAIFSPLENFEFSGTPEQCFLLGYRALARELYTKRDAVAQSGLRRNLDKGKTPAEQVLIQATIHALEIGLAAGLRDISCYKILYDGILESRRFAPVRAYIIEFEYPPPVMCSGAIWPEQDFVGANLQDVAHLSSAPDLVCFTSFHGGERGVVAFAWLATHDRTCRPFVESLDAVPDSDLTAALLRFFFSHCENIHLKPPWWETLPEVQRQSLLGRMEVSADTEMARPAAYLASDGVAYSSWAVVRRYRIGY